MSHQTRPVAEVIAFDTPIHDEPTRDNPCFCGRPECPDSGADTRHTRISQRKLAYQGAEYEAEWLGVQVIFTTFEGQRRLGTIARWEGGYPIAEFGDGTWARLDTHVEVVI